MIEVLVPGSSFLTSIISGTVAMSDLKSTPLGPWRVIGNSNIQGAARASAYLGSLVPTVLAVVFLSTPRLRRQWAFRILVLALIVALGKGILELQVRMRVSVDKSAREATRAVSGSLRES